ncbi:hypothetical protein [Neorhizobium tomejilense]|uniref:hypothetical protein n=1 Tax=Neorhizobium tomejilense TaxID=2093828 RepID=UPI00155E465A|nr:hypothetical protein [Neorhizobium tomejilense]
MIFLIFGFMIVTVQVIGFLRFGWWGPMSVSSGLGHILPGEWFQQPRSWFGLHRILNAVPASICAFVIGGLFLAASRPLPNKGDI